MTALLDDLFEVEIGVLDKFIDCLLISEHTIFVCLTVFEYTEVWLAWHEQPLLHNVHQAEAKEIQRNVHKVGRRERH